MSTMQRLDGRHSASPYELLAAWDVRVWAAGDVEAYMAQQVALYPGNWAWRIQRRLPRETLRKVLNACIPMSFSVVLMSGVLALTASLTVADTVWFPSIAVLLVLAACSIADEFIPVLGVAWEESPCDLRTPMPAFAKRAMRIAASGYPYHSFTLSELREVRTRAIIDPVLFLNIPHPLDRKLTLRIAIAVWDEHGNEVLPPN